MGLNLSSLGPCVFFSWCWTLVFLWTKLQHKPEYHNTKVTSLLPIKTYEQFPAGCVRFWRAASGEALWGPEGDTHRSYAWIHHIWIVAIRGKKVAFECALELRTISEISTVHFCQWKFVNFIQAHAPPAEGISCLSRMAIFILVFFQIMQGWSYIYN